MGYYINTPSNTNKANYIVDNYVGIKLPVAPAWEAIPDNCALIVVVHNQQFEAAGYAYDEDEYVSFMEPDARPREYVLIPKGIAMSLTGYDGS